MPTAEEVFNSVASLLNDQAQAVFTDAVQMPYLNMALQDLGQRLQLDDIPVTLETSTVIPIEAEVDNIGGSGVGDPPLPTGFINVKQLWQRPTGTNIPFLPIPQYQFLPHFWDSIITSEIPAWAYLDQVIKLIPANMATDIKMDYVRSIIPTVTDEDDSININNSLPYLRFRTAGYCAYYIGENESRATILNQEAERAYNEMSGIEVKGQQGIVTRRRPFMAAWKNRGIW